MNNNEQPKPVTERDNLGLFQLCLELYSRAGSQPNNKKMHDFAFEAVEEMKKRLSHPQEPQVKSAEEILQEYLPGFEYTYQFNNRPDIIKAMNKFASQFKSEPTEVKEKENFNEYKLRYQNIQEHLTRLGVTEGDEVGEFGVLYRIDLLIKQMKSEPTEELKKAESKIEHFKKHFNKVCDENDELHGTIFRLKQEIERLTNIITELTFSKSEPKAWTPPTKSQIEDQILAQGSWSVSGDCLEIAKWVIDQYLNSQRKDNNG